MKYFWAMHVKYFPHLMAEKSRMLRMTRAVQGARWTITTRNLTPAHVKICPHINIHISSWVSPSILGMHQLWRSYSNTAWVCCIFRGCMSSRKLSWCHETECRLMVGAGHGAEHSPLTAGTFINLWWSTISRFETSRYPVACWQMKCLPSEYWELGRGCVFSVVSLI